MNFLLLLLPFEIPKITLNHNESPGGGHEEGSTTERDQSKYFAFTALCIWLLEGNSVALVNRTVVCVRPAFSRCTLAEALVGFNYEIFNVY